VDMTRKINSNAALKNLPAKIQAAVIAHIEQGNDFAETAEWLRKKARIEATSESVGALYRRHSLRELLQSSAELSQALAEECKERGWVKSVREQRAAAQVFFNRLALGKQDPKLWSMVEEVNIDRDKVDLERKKLRLRTRRQNDKPPKAKQVPDSGLTAAEKEAAVNQILGIE
jgi:hypothetical protein